jgi:hypothetical protein
MFVGNSLYPYRGTSLEASKEMLRRDRINSKAFDSLVNKWSMHDVVTVCYMRFWDPEKSEQPSRFMDIVVTRLFKTEIDMELTPDFIKTTSDDVSKLLIPEQGMETTQCGVVSEFPNLKYHYYQFLLYNTKIEQRDLGLYHQVRHFFVWNGETFSVTFNFDHKPTSKDLCEIRVFFEQFGRPCELGRFLDFEETDLLELIELYYAEVYSDLFFSLSEEERLQVLDCAVEKLEQQRFVGSPGSLSDEDVFDQTTLGCIEFMSR